MAHHLAGDEKRYAVIRALSRIYDCEGLRKQLFVLGITGSSVVELQSLMSMSQPQKPNDRKCNRSKERLSCGSGLSR
jgi:hypothetical protein